MADITAIICASERGRNVLDSCRGERCVGCGKLARALSILDCVFQTVRSSMTEQTVPDQVQRIAQMEEHMNTASQSIRDAGFRVQAVDTATGAAGVREGTVPTALVDTRLLEKRWTFSGAITGRHCDVR